MYKYKNKLDKGEEIFYSKYWNETTKNDNNEYFARIISLKDSIWEIEYFNKNKTKLYKGHYSNLYSKFMNGEFIWYYPNENIRKKATFLNNELQNYAYIYFPNGKIHYMYKFKDDNQLFKVYDNKENMILDKYGNGKEILNDSIMKREIIREFKNYQLISSYYITSNGKAIYQRTEKNAKLIAHKTFQYDLSKKFKFPNESILNNVNGTMLVKIIIEPSGKFSEIKVIKGIDNQIDNQILDLFEKMNDLKRWKPAVKNKIKVTQELVLPINFYISGKPNYNYNHMHFDMQMMQHQFINK